MPWRNGGGTTLEVARSPEGGDPADFDWRVSFAHVDADGPFSAFPGIDRVITLVDGDDMTLTLVGPGSPARRHDLRPFEPFAFAGEDEVECHVGRPTVDLNLMTHRGRCRGSVRVHQPGSEGLRIDPEAEAPGGACLVAVLAGRALVATPRGGEPTSCTALDVLTDLTGPLHVSGDDVVAAVISVTPPA